MPYNEEFFRRYAEYLQEPAVRVAHDWVFQIARLNPAFDQVVDLGCGSCEFLCQTDPVSYIGIDLEPRRPVLNRIYAKFSRKNGHRQGWNFDEDTFEQVGGIRHEYYIAGDYRGNVAGMIDGIDPQPTAFVSLFSTEITAPYNENYCLYWQLFKEIPSLTAGLVAGIYYYRQKDENPICEAGDVVSYQTLESTDEAYPSGILFKERRISLPVPSKMFGPDVYEVWKFFSRTE